MWFGLKTDFNFYRAYLFKRGQVEHVLTMANLKFNPSLFMPRPNVYQVCSKNTQFCSNLVLFKLPLDLDWDLDLFKKYPILLKFGAF